MEKNGGAWCPRGEATQHARDYLEVDLRSEHVVTGVETQGRFGNGQGQEYAEHFLLEYWRDSLAKWVRYKYHNNSEVSTPPSLIVSPRTPPSQRFSTQRQRRRNHPQDVVSSQIGFGNSGRMWTGFPSSKLGLGSATPNLWQAAIDLELPVSSCIGFRNPELHDMGFSHLYWVLPPLSGFATR